MNVATKGRFVLMCLVLLCGLVAVSTQLQRIPLDTVRIPADNASHAIARHGPDAVAVRNCLDRGGTYQIWQQPNGNFLKICWMPTSNFGIQVCKDMGTCFDEVTAFVKERIFTTEDLQTYLNNAKAWIVWPIP